MTAYRTTRCSDCAFRPKSPERRNPFGPWLRIHEQLDAGGPHFHCHQGMPVVDGRYVPEPGKSYPICAGYAKAFELKHGTSPSNPTPPQDSHALDH
jgi:hypothetical protein